MDLPDIRSRTGLQTKSDALKFLEDLFEIMEWEDDEVILDLGCGAGDMGAFILFPYLPLHVKMVGCDISEDLVTMCQKKYKDERVTFKIMDIEDKNIWDNWERESFNKIFSFYVMHWITDKRQAAINMYNLLKPGGEVFLIFLAFDPVMKAITEVREKDIGWEEYLKSAISFAGNNSEDKAMEYKGILEEAGFKDVVVNIRDKMFRYQRMDNMLSFVDAMLPKSMPANKRIIFISYTRKVLVGKGYARIFPTNGKVRSNYVLAEIYAKKYPKDEALASPSKKKESFKTKMLGKLWKKKN